MSDLNVHNHYRTMTRQEVADELRQLATQLESHGHIPYATGTVAVPDPVEREFMIDASGDDTTCAFAYKLKWWAGEDPL